MYPSLLRTSGDWFADFEQLQDRMDELLGGRCGASRASAPSAVPAPSRRSTSAAAPEAVEIYAFAPGIDPKSIDVSVEKGLLAISGERKAQDGQAAAARPARAHRLRQRALRPAASGASSRLSEDADPGRVEASYRNGVLKIVVPKREVVEAAPDPGQERQLMPARPHPAREESHHATAIEQHRDANAAAAAARSKRTPGPRRRCCRRSTSSRTPAASRCCADLPGVDREDLSIGVDGRNLTIEAPLRLGEASSLVPVYAEVRANHFRRSFELSSDLDTGQDRRRPARRRADAAHPQARAGQAAPHRRPRRVTRSEAEAPAPPLRVVAPRARLRSPAPD